MIVTAYRVVVKIKGENVGEGHWGRVRAFVLSGDETEDLKMINTA